MLLPSRNSAGGFGAAFAAQIAASLKLEVLDGDGDECGGFNPYKLTFKTDPAGPMFGVDWGGGWISTNC